MIRRLECVSIYTKDLAASVAFYAGLGLSEGWRIERVSGAGVPLTLVGLKFADSTSSELVLSDNAEVPFTEIELLVDDVRQSRREWADTEGITWIREPFATESGHVAVMEAPDGNVFVLVGA